MPTITRGLAVAAMLASTAGAQIIASPAPSLVISERSNEMVFDLGPFDLAPGGTAVVENPLTRVTVPAGGWMHGYSVEVVDRRGAPVPQRLLRHMYVIAIPKRDLFDDRLLHVAAAAGETEPIALPRILGYELKKGDTLRVEVGLRDNRGEGWTGLHVRIRFRRTSARSLLGAVAIVPFYLTVPPPTAAAMIPPGMSESFWEGRPVVSGRIFGVSGHGPPYAVRMRLEDRTSGKVLWDVRPDTNAHGESLPIPVKRFLPFGTGIRADHVYRLTVTYRNASPAPRPASSGWGVLGGVFMPSAGTVWPAVGMVPGGPP